MSKLTKLSELTDELKRCGEKLIEISDSIQDLVSTADETEVTDWEELTDEEPADVPILLGDVRAVLAEKSRRLSVSFLVIVLSSVRFVVCILTLKRIYIKSFCYNILHKDTRKKSIILHKYGVRTRTLKPKLRVIYQTRNQILAS